MLQKKTCIYFSFITFPIFGEQQYCQHSVEGDIREIGQKRKKNLYKKTKENNKGGDGNDVGGAVVHDDADDNDDEDTVDEATGCT